MDYPTTTVLTIGSINMDSVIRCPKIPVLGETVIAQAFHKNPGGKGANQAVAVARLGAHSLFCACVGEDSNGIAMRDSLRAAGVYTDALKVVNGITGRAYVVVDAQGNNSIVVVPGANAHLLVEDVEKIRPLLQKSKVVLLQMEIPIKTVARAIEIARDEKVTVVLDSAPIPPSGMPSELFLVDVLSPNQSEANLLTGLPCDSREEALVAAQRLIKKGCKNVVLKLAEKGALWVDGKGGHRFFDPFTTPVTDTTGAGDAFTAAFAVRLGEGASFPEAIRFACAAGAITVSRSGAIPALPDRLEVEKLLENQT